MEKEKYYVCCHIKGKEDVEIGQRKMFETLEEAEKEILKKKRGRHHRKLDYKILIC